MNIRVLFILALFCINIYSNKLIGNTSATSNIAITYRFSGGRFGDNLLAFSHAAWLSYALDVPLVYNPFPHSDRLTLHAHPKVHKLSNFSTFQKLPLGSVDGYLNFLKLLNNNKITNPTLYELLYYPESPSEYDVHAWLPQYLEVDWEDKEFIHLLRSYIAPAAPLPKQQPPKDRISVAMHVRRGGDFDPKDWELGSPLKAPSDQFYVDALTYLYKAVDKPMYVFIFTDHLKPTEIQEKFVQTFQGWDVIFECHKERPADLLEDFFSMENFDCLIRTDSNFSLMASYIFPFKAIVSPKRVTKIDEKTFVIDRFLIQMAPNEKIHKPLKIIFRK